MHLLPVSSLSATFYRFEILRSVFNKEAAVEIKSSITLTILRRFKGVSQLVFLSSLTLVLVH